MLYLIHCIGITHSVYSSLSLCNELLLRRPTDTLFSLHCTTEAALPLLLSLPITTSALLSHRSDTCTAQAPKCRRHQTMPSPGIGNYFQTTKSMTTIPSTSSISTTTTSSIIQPSRSVSALDKAQTTPIINNLFQHSDHSHHKNLFRKQQQLIRATHYLSFLTSCAIDNLVSRVGLQIQKSLNVMLVTKEFEEE